MGGPRIPFPETDGRTAVWHHFPKSEGLCCTIWDNTLILSTRNSKTVYEALLVPGI